MSDVTLMAKKHCSNVQGLENQKQIDSFFPSENDSLQEKVTRAEVKVATVLAHHDIPIAVTDHLSPLFKDIFPDSSIAKLYSCAQSKTTCILNGALAVDLQKSLVDHMKNEPFSLATDGSNDSGLQKMNPLTVHIYDADRGRVMTQLLDMCLTMGSTAEAIYTKINEALMKFGVDWNKCVAFGIDNTSVNIGKRNSIKTRVQQQNPAIYFMGCPCHMVHNTATKGAEAFQGETGFDVEDILVDLYYWFDKSTKRKNQLSEFCDFCDVKSREVIKHVSTCWLSLELAVERALKVYAGLKSYFLSSEETQPRFGRLKQHFENPLTEVYLMFYQAVLPSFTSINKFLQRETPCIHVIHERLQSFLTTVLSKFVKISVIREAQDNEDLINVDFVSTDNQLPDSTVFIGFITKQMLNKLLDDGDIGNSEMKRCYKGVRIFYTTATQYIIKTYPLKDEILMHARFVNFEKRDQISFDSVQFFVHHFPHLHNLTSPGEVELLQEEFIRYQLQRDADIPDEVWEEAKVNEDEDVYNRVDVLWSHLCKMQKIGSSQPMFLRLAQVAKVVLVIPHSNASEERIFSMVRKNKTPFHPSLGLDGTLPSILQVKLGVDDPCEKLEPTKQLLEKAKKVTWEYNKAHSSKH